MLIQRNGVYVSWINNHRVELIYLRKNAARLFIDGAYQGICSFAYTKKAINKIEENPISLYNLKEAEKILLKDLQEPKKR